MNWESIAAKDLSPRSIEYLREYWTNLGIKNPLPWHLHAIDLDVVLNSSATVSTFIELKDMIIQLKRARGIKRDQETSKRQPKQSTANVSERESKKRSEYSLDSLNSTKTNGLERNLKSFQLNLFIPISP